MLLLIWPYFLSQHSASAFCICLPQTARAPQVRDRGCRFDRIRTIKNLSASDRALNNETSIPPATLYMKESFPIQNESNIRRQELSPSHRTIETTSTPLVDVNPTVDHPRRPLARLLYDFWYGMTAPFPDLRKIARKRDEKAKFVISLRLQDGLAALLIYLGV